MTPPDDQPAPADADEVMAEVRRCKAESADAAGRDVRRLGAQLRETEARLTREGRRVVRRPPTRIVPPASAKAG